MYNINLEVSKKFQLAPNVHFVEHRNLLIDELSSILLDKKHLNESGIKTFSKNLKDGLFGRLNLPTTFRRPTSPPKNEKYEFPEKSGPYSGNRSYHKPGHLSNNGNNSNSNENRDFWGQSYHDVQQY